MELLFEPGDFGVRRKDAALEVVDEEAWPCGYRQAQNVPQRRGLHLRPGRGLRAVQPGIRLLGADRHPFGHGDLDAEGGKVNVEGFENLPSAGGEHRAVVYEERTVGPQPGGEFRKGCIREAEAEDVVQHAEGESAVVLPLEDGEVCLGVVGSADGLEEGELMLRSKGGASLVLKNDGRVLVNGRELVV